MFLVTRQRPCRETRTLRCQRGDNKVLGRVRYEKSMRYEIVPPPPPRILRRQKVEGRWKEGGARWNLPHSASALFGSASEQWIPNLRSFLAYPPDICAARGRTSDRLRYRRHCLLSNAAWLIVTTCCLGSGGGESRQDAVHTSAMDPRPID